MKLTPDQSKNEIRSHIRKNNVVDTLLGELIIEKELGQGGNALVYSGKWGNNTVAIKFLAEDCSVEISSRYQRFVTEFRELVKLSSTNAIIPVYLFGELIVGELKFPYIVMERCKHTLSEEVRVNPVNDLDQLLKIVDDLINCLSIIHSKHIVHRDLKPQNILITYEGKLILGDFGISWFDPEHYERLAKTEKGDRLANFGFSAPEQFQKNPDPKPTMDLYALGQVIQWIVTGETVRGTGRTLLASVNSSFAPLDSIVESLVQQNPDNRPQSAEEVRQAIKDALNTKEREPSEEEVVINILREFDRILRFALPGERGLIRITDKTKIDKLLFLLSENATENRLWWTQGTSNCPIGSSMRKIDEDTWLIDYGEHRIEEVWVKKDSYSLDHQYVLLQCAPMPSFGIYDKEYEYEEAAWFRDRYITRAEYDDGVTEIDGVTIELNREAELRTREMKRDFLFIATNVHPILLFENDEIVRRVYKIIKENDMITPEFLAPLDRLKRHRISIMMS